MSGEGERKLLLRALRGETTPRPPFWLMRQAGRYLPEYRAIRSRAGGFLDLCYTPDFATEVTLQPVRRFKTDAAILFSDILVVPDALGADVRFVEGEGPLLVPITTAGGVAALDTGRLASHLAPVLETVGRVRASLPPEVALIGFAGAPWTLAAYMVEGGGSKDYQAARTLARTEPALFARLIDTLVDAIGEFLVLQADAGAEVVQLFDSWAGVLPEDELERWCIAPARRIAETFGRLRPDVPLICFPRGIGALYPRFAAEVPCAGLSLDTTVSVSWAATALRQRPGLCLQGNLDPVALLAGGDVMLGEAARIVAALRGRPHIFNLGHGVVPQTRPEEVARLAAYLHSLAG